MCELVALPLGCVQVHVSTNSKALTNLGMDKVLTPALNLQGASLFWLTSINPSIRFLSLLLLRSWPWKGELRGGECLPDIPPCRLLACREAQTTARKPHSRPAVASSPEVNVFGPWVEAGAPGENTQAQNVLKKKLQGPAARQCH